jgi:hypothetical protein
MIFIQNEACQYWEGWFVTIIFVNVDVSFFNMLLPPLYVYTIVPAGFTVRIKNFRCKVLWTCLLRDLDRSMHLIKLRECCLCRVDGNNGMLV